MSRPLASTSTASNNILLKITVPKRTGRKRKRGSSEPYMNNSVIDPSAVVTPRDARNLLRRLRDNIGRYEVEAVGRVERTHVFRGRFPENNLNVMR